MLQIDQLFLDIKTNCDRFLGNIYSFKFVCKKVKCLIYIYKIIKNYN